MILGLPEKLKELRQKYGFSQSTVGKRIGVSAAVVSNYETGERTPSAVVLLNLSYLYHCSTDYLLGRKNNDDLPVMLDVSALTQDQLEIINSLLCEFDRCNKKRDKP